MRVLIAVTHLLGAGHLTRAAALARTFAAAGHEATLVSGGMPSPLVRLGGARLIQLPPVRVEGIAFGRLIGADGRPADAALLEARSDALLAALADAAPDAVITELFPFGRRILAAEYLALVEAARARPHRPLVLASVRDILVPPDRASKVAQAHDRIMGLYDAVLVHGDPAIAPLDASWPVDAALAPKLHYTGYVDEGGPVPPATERRGVLVAAGSSSAGLGLFGAAIAAARMRADLSWRILVGHGVPDADLARLADGLPPGIVMRARTDYRDLLAAAAVSVSQCGYNTAIDLLVTRTPSVLVPFEAGRETEQRLRAERLAALGLARIVPEAGLTPEALIAAVEDALSPQGTKASDGTSPYDPQAPVPPALEGAARTVALVTAMRKRADGFAALRSALDRAAHENRRVPLWWRDDDAVAATPALDRLLSLAEGTPILIAAIPAKTDASLARRLAGASDVSLAVHGLAHDNHAPPGERSAEFGPHRPLEELRAEAARALALAREHLPPDRLLPVFVPPWNRMSDALARVLPELGYRGLSAAGGPAMAGLRRAEATLDVIDWRGSRSLRAAESLLAPLTAHAMSGSAEPLGLLTHHLAHDETVWAFLAELIPLLAGHPAVAWHDPRDLFGPPVDEPPREPISSFTERPRAV
ncbi:MAG: glycosyl transferase family 28 [Actinomycetospora chiangmaiensis]|nr:glycosyl transferase family 28 [Actinomycetospora chiangmaiensis]